MAFLARKVSGGFEERYPEPVICTVPGEDQKDDGSSPIKKMRSFTRRDSSSLGDF